MDILPIEQALAELRPAFDADGFDLRVGPGNTDGCVELILERKPGACADCLVPEEVMIQIVESAIRSSGSDLRIAGLRRVGFEPSDGG